jgi:hypothetical protein
MGILRRLNLILGGSWHPHPHPGWFLPKSAETLENKRVEFCVSVKNGKRVRRSVKGKGIGASEGLNVGKPRREKYSAWRRHPLFFCKCAF